jgi:D-alanine-D-alanine ligase
MSASNPNDLTFRYHVQADDRQVVRRIVESTRFFSLDEIEVAVELVDERLSKGIASGYHFVFAERHHVVLGYACLGPIACTAASFDIYWIAVDQAHQQRGLGRCLMREAERQVASQGGRRIYVETSNRPQYAPTREFYLRCGYEVAAILPDFYNEGDDKVILQKTIRDLADTDTPTGPSK